MRKYYFSHNEETATGLREIWIDNHPAHDVVVVTEQRDGESYRIYERDSGRIFFVSRQEYVLARASSLSV